MGTVENFEWEFVEDGLGDKAIYDIGYDGDFSVMRKTTRLGRLKSGHRESFTSGSCYFVSAGDIHATEVCSREFALTAAVFSKMATNKSYVVGCAKGKDLYRFRRTSVWNKELSEITNEIIQEISGLLA